MTKQETEIRNQKVTGVVIMFSAVTLFFISMFYIDYGGKGVSTSMENLGNLVAFVTLSLGLYGGGYSIGGHSVALKWGLFSASFFILAIILGHVRALLPEAIQGLFVLAVYTVILFSVGYFSQQPRSIKRGLKIVSAIYILFAVLAIFGYFFGTN